VPVSRGKDVQRVKQVTCSPKSKDSLENPGTFVWKLFSMVENEPDHLIRWVHDGTAFHVVDTKAFSQICLPKYFRHTRMASLIRQLNFYSFHKINTSSEVMYQHTFFREGRSDLLKKIKRRGTGKAKDPIVGGIKGGASDRPKLERILLDDPPSPISMPQSGEVQPFTPYGASENRLWSQTISPSSLSPVLQAKTFSVKELKSNNKGKVKATSLDILAMDKLQAKVSPESDLISALPTDEAPWLSRNTSFVRLGNEMVDAMHQKDHDGMMSSQAPSEDPTKLSLISSCSSNSLALDCDAGDEAWIRPLSPLTLPENSSWGDSFDDL
jgi:hypothetical protein